MCDDTASEGCVEAQRLSGHMHAVQPYESRHAHDAAAGTRAGDQGTALLRRRRAAPRKQRHGVRTGCAAHER